MSYDSMGSYFVKVEAETENGKIIYRVDPVGRFSDGTGAIAMAYVKPERLLEAKSADQLMDLLMKAIDFENLEGLFSLDQEGYPLGEVLKYTEALEETEENGFWLGYFKQLGKDTEKFRKELSEAKEIRTAVVHQFHVASGEECDFTDYLCCPVEDDAEVMRQWLVDNLSEDSEIDALMDCYDWGEFSVHSYECDTAVKADYQNDTAMTSQTVTNVG